MPIIDPSRNAWHVDDATRAGLLIDGRAYYKAFYEAARRARRSILIAGWQFDSGVRLVRGDDVPSDTADGPAVQLLPFLNGLCDANPNLRIDLLAWDFSVVYALERELWQKIIFDWQTNARMRFRFDSQCPIGGSHHQKFAVIDDALAFVGGTDLCEHRWDDREHVARNPLRVNPDGTSYNPYHEVQTYVAGPAARRMTELFAQRWLSSGGSAVAEHTPSAEPAPWLADLPTAPSVVFPPGPAAFSRTRPKCDDPVLAEDASRTEESVPARLEIKTLLEDAIGAAESLIYIETQYLTSRALLRALLARLTDTARSKLEIVLLLPQHPEDTKEQIAVGVAQSKLLEQLSAVAKENGHAFGLYNVVSVADNGEELYEYIHAKLMIVDDRFITVGSANMTNRSMGLDTELNVAWEADTLASDLGRRIARARVTLLAEHVGATDLAEIEKLVAHKGLVAYLESLSTAKSTRLRHHEIGGAKEPAIMALIDPGALELLDPEGPKIEEELDASLGSAFRSLMTGHPIRAWATFTQSTERGE